MNLDSLIDDIIKREGGYVNDPDDHGGPTKYGVTLKTLRAWRDNPHLGAGDVENLTVDEARKIYRRDYFEGPGFAQLPMALWPFVTDAAVHHGVDGAIKMLQRAVGATPDGVLGPLTLEKVNALEPRLAAAAFVAQRARKFGERVHSDYSQAKFIHGWLNRLAEQIMWIPNA